MDGQELLSAGESGDLLTFAVPRIFQMLLSNIAYSSCDAIFPNHPCILPTSANARYYLIER